MACRKARTKSKKEIHQTSGARTQTAGSPISAHCKPHYCHQKKCQTLENAPGHTAYITAVHQTLLSCGRAILLQVVMEKALQTAFYTFVNISSLFFFSIDSLSHPPHSAPRSTHTADTASTAQDAFCKGLMPNTSYVVLPVPSCDFEDRTIPSISLRISCSPISAQNNKLFAYCHTFL